MLAVALDPKRLATLRARAALAGVYVHALEGDDGRPLLIATRWALTRQMDNLDELEAWLDRVAPATMGFRP